MIKKHSAGGIVIGVNYKVIVVNQNNDSWSLPKGHIDPGENALQAAVREIYEESGVEKLTLIKKLGEYDRYRIPKAGEVDKEKELKHLTIFLFTTEELNLNPIDPDNPEARWLNIEDVEDMLTHPKDKDFFKSCIPELVDFLASRSTSKLQ